MIADYSHQLRYKAHRVRHAFERVSLDTATVMDPWSSPRVLGYRARSQFKTDGKQIGYAGRMGRSIAPITQCLVLNERMSAQFSSLKESLPNPAWTPGDNFAFTFIDVNEETDLASAAVQINKRQAFKQANNLQNVRMKEWLETGLADHPRQRAVVELFCGSGNLTQTVVSLGFNQVAAMDIQSVALDELAARQLSGVTVTALDLYGPSVSNRITRAFPDTAILLVNPPRYGLKELVRLAAILNKLETIFYISCNPVTCAFDLKKILGLSKGWRISGIQPIDMMPHTPHIEILGRLDRR